MDIALITGSAGLVGSESSRFLAAKGMQILGIDNDMRQYFFGKDASTEKTRKRLEIELPNYTHYPIDIRNQLKLEEIFKEYSSSIKLIVHTAAQPSHDWAATDPFTDFSVNASGTLYLLELARMHSPKCVFILCSTNKVYGDRSNFLPLDEKELRWELSKSHPYFEFGIDENFSIDQCKHSLFGASKVSADILAQEYGRYFGMKCAVFRGGCITGPGHAGSEMHGFLAYLMKCAISQAPYTVFGYKGKQVRDNIHSHDLVRAFYEFYLNPRSGEVYNIGGGRYSHCSMLEAIAICEKITGKTLSWNYSDKNRIGDHIWWISDTRKFQSHFPDWRLTRSASDILVEIHDTLSRA